MKQRLLKIGKIVIVLLIICMILTGCDSDGNAESFLYRKDGEIYYVTTAKSEPLQITTELHGAALYPSTAEICFVEDSCNVFYMEFPGDESQQHWSELNLFFIEKLLYGNRDFDKTESLLFY